jgi:hypothetical protein
VIDTKLLGHTTARCMDYMDDHEGLDGGTIIAVGLIVVAESADGTTTFTRTFCSDERHYQQVGIMAQGMTCVVEGVKNVTGEEEGDDPEADD